jgi:hypothetical protein
MPIWTRPCANVGYSSKGHITFSAQGWREYEELIAEAHIAHRDHLNDLMRRVEALEERGRSS